MNTKSRSTARLLPDSAQCQGGQYIEPMRHHSYKHNRQKPWASNSKPTFKTDMRKVSTKGRQP